MEVIMKKNDKNKLVILDGKTIGKLDVFANLLSLPDKMTFEYYEKTESQVQVLERCQGARIIATNKVALRRDTLDELIKFENLECILVLATGLDHIDFEYARSKNIKVFNIVQYSTFTVAQHVLGMVLWFTQKLSELNQYCLSGQWQRDQLFCHPTLATQSLEGKIWGLVGTGKIAQQTAVLAYALGAKVFMFSSSGRKLEESKNSNGPSIQYVKSLEEMFSIAQVISIHVPLRSDTHQLIGKKLCDLLGDESILVNVARGQVVDEVGLIESFKNKNWFYGSDVFVDEPFNNRSPWKQLFQEKKYTERLLVTPHIAWKSENSLAEMFRQVNLHLTQF